MKKPGKREARELIALMCKNEHAKALRELLTKVGEKWSILVVVMLARAIAASILSTLIVTNRYGGCYMAATGFELPLENGSFSDVGPIRPPSG